MSESKSDIIEKQSGISKSSIMPVLNPEEAQKAYKTYLELCQSVLIPYDDRIVDERGVVIQESDYARIPQRKKNENGEWVTEYVDSPKKSAFRKLARFYGVSTEILEKQRTVSDGVVTWHYTIRAWQGDVSTMGEGACSTDERKGMSEHDAKATAQTRAKSRAISDLIGFGQVSAEEMPVSVYRESETVVKDHPVAPVNLSVDSIKGYLEQCGYDSSKFVIRHDEPSRMYVFDKVPYIEDWNQYLSDLREMGAEYDQEFKKSVVRY